MPAQLFPRPATLPAIARTDARRLLFALMLVASGCAPHAAPSPTGAGAKRELPEVTAQVLTLQEQTWPTIVRTQGSLVADEVAPVGSMVAGRVSDVHVDLGDAVSKGTMLVTLDQQDFLLQVAQTEAMLAQARAAVGLKEGESVESLDIENAPPVRQEKAVWIEARSRLDRVLSLKARNATTDEVVDTTAAAAESAEARYLAARNSVSEKIATILVRAAELDIARQRLDNTVVKAPFEGHVQIKHVAPGTYVQVGTPLVTVVRSDPLRFRGSAPERYAQKLKLGQRMTLQVEAVAEPVEATIDRISPSLDESTRSLTFEARVENEDGALRTGLFAEALVTVDPQARALVLPRAALVEFAGAERVWKVVDGIAREQPVRSGQRRDGTVEILSGLQPGDVILVDGAAGFEARIIARREDAPSGSTTSSEASRNPADEGAIANVREGE